MGHLHSGDTNFGPIEGTPLFRGKAHFFWVPKASINLQPEYPLVLTDWPKKSLISLSVHWSQWWQFSKHELHVHVSHLKRCTAQTHNTPEISWSWRLIHYLAVWNNDCSRFQGRIKEDFFYFLVIINKPQPNVHFRGHFALVLRVPPSIEVPLHFHWFQSSTARVDMVASNQGKIKFFKVREKSNFEENSGKIKIIPPLIEHLNWR